MDTIQAAEQRYVHFDKDLGIEAYHLSGIVQKFPNHFHEHYVIGFVENGRRDLCCKGQKYVSIPGDLILFNPKDNHFCSPVDGEHLDYKAVNLTPEKMKQTALEITGQEYTPYFTQTLVPQSDIAKSLHHLYDCMTECAPKLEKEETFFFLLEQLLSEYAAPAEQLQLPEPPDLVRSLCTYMEDHFCENITLDMLLSMTNFSKSYLLRTFTREIGVSPYRYLQTVRLNCARKFLEEGAAPADAAAMAGFSDQSHFTNFFKGFTGLTPKQYQRIFMGKQ